MRLGTWRGRALALLDASPKASRFVILWRTFFAQFFTSESVVSEQQYRQAMIGVLVFLIMPGILIPFQLTFAFEFAAIRFPALMEPLTRLMATVFITYSMVAIGVIAAFVWDSLSLERRDAMVLGPLPFSDAAVILAKLAAMALFLSVAAVPLNLLTALPFAMVAANHKAAAGFAHHLVAHMTATTAAGVFVFCVIVTLRSLVGMIGRGRILIASCLQFSLVSALLCFVVFVPTALKIVAGPRIGGRVVMEVRQQSIPAWSPTNWFLGLHEVVRGTNRGEYSQPAMKAVGFTLGSVVAAMFTTAIGYRRQLQRALAPLASTGAFGMARSQRAIARLLVGRDRVARATADFVLTTIARSRAQQAPVAINAALGLAFVVAGLSNGTEDLTSLLRVRTAILWIPFVLAYWTLIGVRASFFVPSELPAAWTFRFNAPVRSRAYWLAVRASLVAVVLPPTLVASGLLVPLLGWRGAGWNALIASLVTVVLAEAFALTIDFIPFTRPYEAGHAKLKTRWWLYAVGLLAFAYVPARLEFSTIDQPTALVPFLAGLGITIVALEWWGRRRSESWVVRPSDDSDDPLSSVRVLDLSGVTVSARAGS